MTAGQKTLELTIVKWFEECNRLNTFCSVLKHIDPNDWERLSWAMDRIPALSVWTSKRKIVRDAAKGKPFEHHI